MKVEIPTVKDLEYDLSDSAGNWWGGWWFGYMHMASGLFIAFDSIFSDDRLAAGVSREVGVLVGMIWFLVLFFLFLSEFNYRRGYGARIRKEIKWVKRGETRYLHERNIFMSE